MSQLRRAGPNASENERMSAGGATGGGDAITLKLESAAQSGVRDELDTRVMLMMDRFAVLVRQQQVLLLVISQC